MKKFQVKMALGGRNGSLGKANMTRTADVH